MQDNILSNNYSLKRKDEIELIQDINNLIQSFETYLNINTIYINSPEILEKASYICEMTLKLLLKKKWILY